MGGIFKSEGRVRSTLIPLLTERATGAGEGGAGFHIAGHVQSHEAGGRVVSFPVLTRRAKDTCVADRSENGPYLRRGSSVCQTVSARI